MRFLAKVGFVWLALLGVVSTAHCRWETLTGFAFLQCHASEQHAESSARTNPAGHCDAGCCAVETEDYLAARMPHLPRPDFVALAAPALQLGAASRPEFASISREATRARPPDHLADWRFLQRVAPSPRAPGFLV